jgi:hypothetical protein
MESYNMKEKINGRIIWNAASKTGLIFAAVTIACTLLKNGAAAIMSGFPLTITAIVLWALQFFGCIFLMRFFMKKLVSDFDDVTNAETFKLGRRIALFSAFLVAGFSAIMVLVKPETITEAFDTAIAQYSSMLDSNSLSAIESMKENMPVITFFSTFIYCFLYGYLLSFIMSRYFPDSNPFKNE